MLAAGPQRPARLLVLAALVLTSRTVRAEDVLQLGSCDVVPPETLVEALRLRLAGPVEYRPEARPVPGIWVLAAVSDGEGAQLILQAPDGRMWDRPVAFPGPVDDTERARALALQAGYVASLAGAPFAADDLPPGPAPLPAATSRVGLDLDLVFLGIGTLWGTADGEDIGFRMVARPNLVWSWGLWVEAEVGWHRLQSSRESDVALDSIPLRLGLGGVIPLDSWDIRFAVQAIADYWRTSGDARAVSGWRGGAGLIALGTYHLAPCCAVGLEAGMEFLPRAVQIDFAGEPLVALGQLQWHAGVWFGFELAVL